MDLKLTYPPIEKRLVQRKKVLRILRWPMVFAAYASVVVNLVLGGKAWSAVVFMALYMVWKLIFSVDLVEYNRISQLVKSVIYVCILLVLIDVLLAPGWAELVVPLVCLGGIVVSGILFFSDVEKQRQNLFPLLMLCVVSGVAAALALCIGKTSAPWAFAAMGAGALGVLVAIISVLGSAFLRELRCRFHVH